MLGRLVRLQLRSQSWQPIPIERVHLAFFRSEFDTLPGRLPSDTALARNPDPTNEAENKRRKELLYGKRSPLLAQVPDATEWYEVRFLREQNLHQLRAINHPEWRSRADRNELSKVARRKVVRLREEPHVWDPPILWGHERTGPFTILDGNNRLTGYARLTWRPRLRIPVYIGLCTQVCVWHLPDRPDD